MTPVHFVMHLGGYFREATFSRVDASPSRLTSLSLDYVSINSTRDIGPLEFRDDWIVISGMCNDCVSDMCTNYLLGS
jgi:hypothetical protein